METEETTNSMKRDPDWTGLLILVLLWTGLAGYFFIFWVLAILYPVEESVNSLISSMTYEELEAQRTWLHIKFYAFISGSFAVTIAPAVWLIWKYKNRSR